MRVERFSINKRQYYFVDGVKITEDALNAVIKGVYGADACSKMYRDLFSKGFAVLEKYVGDGNEQLLEQLERTNKKIAALEKKVTELTIKTFTPNSKRRRGSDWND
ncbi:MAG: hypothetical protein II857_08795 [Selenomonadaceae bacterium]|nr:hypothetical protein [Selenomonadaceae bacterium]